MEVFTIRWTTFRGSYNSINQNYLKDINWMHLECIFLEDKMYVGVRCPRNMKKHTLKNISITTPYTFILKLWISNDVVERGLRNGCTPKMQLNETLVKAIQGCGLSIIHNPRKCIVHVKTYRKGNKILLDKTIENKYWALLGNKRYYNAQ